MPTETGAEEQHNHKTEIKQEKQVEKDKHHDQDKDADEDHKGHDDEGKTHDDHQGNDTDEGHGEHDADAEEGHEGHEVDEEHGEHDADAEEGHEGHDDELVVEVSPDAMKMAGITLDRVTRGRIGRSIDLPGQVGFDEDHLVHVTPRFAGIAKEARYRVGAYVNEGDVVAIIESNESMTPYNIEASISGWIIKRHVVPGEFVSEETSIYLIADLSHVWVNLAVYPKDAGYIKPGLEAIITAIGSDNQTEGTIDYVTPVLDLDTRSITARVILANPDNSWRPGTFVQAQVLTDPGDEGLLIEKAAVQILNEEQVVFVPDGEGRFRPVDVETGDADSQSIRILSGLEEGAEYVAHGAFELKAKIVTSTLGGHAGHGH
jgi:cobalt-zinc-cadmium efflux system membrane fusion protein